MKKGEIEQIDNKRNENNNKNATPLDKKPKHKHKKLSNKSNVTSEEDKKPIKEDKRNTQDFIAENFVILNQVGKGAFGEIFLSFSVRDDIEVAIKIEKKRPQKPSQLKSEGKIYQTLLNISPIEDVSGVKGLVQEEIQGVPKFYGVGESVDSHYLIMEFLGPNLNDLFNFCHTTKFTIPCVCLIAIQLLNRIEYLHKHNYIHRDVKPENFVIGVDEKSTVIYLIDFGLSKRYKNPKTHQHITYREGRPLVGTARYVSINTHLGVDQSRRDDLESIGYVLIYFLKGTLPWQGLKEGTDKYVRIMEKKLQIPTEILCLGLSDEIIHYLNYCKTLRFEDRPSYDYLRNLFIKLLGNCSHLYNITKDYLKFDWCFDDINMVWKFYQKPKGNTNSTFNTFLLSPSHKKLSHVNISSLEKGGDESAKNKDSSHVVFKKNLEKCFRNKSVKQLSKIEEANQAESMNRSITINSNGNLSINNLKTNENNPNISLSSKNESDNLSNTKVTKEKEVKKDTSSEDTVELDPKESRADILKDSISQKDFQGIFNSISNEDIDEYIMKLVDNQNKSNSRFSLGFKEKSDDDYLKDKCIIGSIKSQLKDSIDIMEKSNQSKRKIKNNEDINCNSQMNKENTSSIVSNHLDDSLFKNTITNSKVGCTENEANTLNALNLQTTINNTNHLNVTLTMKENLLTNRSNKENEKLISFEKGLSNHDINERRKSKILAMSNVILSDIKFSKEHLISISKEPLLKYYKIINGLGQGSFGQVKRVKHLKLNEERAMKIVNKKSESSHNEIEILRRISHPNIVNIYEILEDSKKYYIMYEVLEGGELFEAITAQKYFTESDGMKIMKQILKAVNYLHCNNIVHRDLKPENIMLVSKNNKANKFELKIIDFGAAKQMNKGEKLSQFIGTSYYIAPEVLKQNYDEKCDIWSCGVIMHILLCGYPPFNGGCNIDIFHSITHCEPLFCGEEWKDVSSEAIDLIKSMLNKNPMKRYNAETCLNHSWFKQEEEKTNYYSLTHQTIKDTKLKVIQKMAVFVKENCLKQAVLQYITTHFNLVKEKEKLTEMFKVFDINKTGLITKEAFSKQLIKLYGENDAAVLTENMFNNLDLDGNGEISYNEFLTSLINNKKVLTSDRLDKAFKMFDKDGNGKLSISEIKQAFGGEEKVWQKVIEEVDKNKDKEIDFAEFKALMNGIDSNIVLN